MPMRIPQSVPGVPCAPQKKILCAPGVSQTICLCIRRVSQGLRFPQLYTRDQSLGVPKNSQPDIPPPPLGGCFNFHSGRGGGSPLDPLDPSPLRSNSPENQGFGNVFSFGPIFSSHAFGAPIAAFFGHSTTSFLPSVADTMSQRPISAFFSTLVQPCPRIKCDDVVNVILYFRFQDEWTRKKRQEAYIVA